MQNYTIALEKFEGPLELLLELIEKNKLDISDVSLAQVTDQYLAHLDRMREKEPRHLADFLVVAARLILIKSKSLLPFFSASEEEEEQMSELKRSLEQYQKIRAGAKMLAALEKESRVSYHKLSEFRHMTIFLPPEDITAETLLERFRAIEKTWNDEFKLEEQGIGFIVSFEEKIKSIKKRLESGLQEFFHALANGESKLQLIISFLAVLELSRQKFLTAEQSETFGEIRLVKCAL